MGLLIFSLRRRRRFAGEDQHSPIRRCPRTIFSFSGEKERIEKGIAVQQNKSPSRHVGMGSLIRHLGGVACLRSVQSAFFESAYSSRIMPSILSTEVLPCFAKLIADWRRSE